MKIDVMTKDKNIKTVVPALRFPEFRDGEGWMRTPILEICEIIGGGTPSSSNDVYWNGDIPWISSSDINENNISEITPTRHITKDAIKHSATKLCKAPSIHIVSRVGVGKVAFSRVDICTSQDFTNLCNINCNYIFLSYLLSTIMKQKVQETQGTSIKGIASAEIKNLHVPLPEIEEQQRIADCLSSLDDLISAVADKIETLEEYKKGLMQQLFPAEGKTTPDIRFPEFQNEGKWILLPIKKCNIDILTGYAFKGSEILEDNNGTPLMRGINITEGVVRHNNDIDRFYSREDHTLSKYRLLCNDLVIAMDGSKVGRNFALINKQDEGSLLVQRVARLRADNIDFIMFIYQQIGSDRFKKYIDRINTSSGIPHISLKQIEDFKIWTTRNDKEFRMVTNCLSSVDELISTETAKLDQLKNHKKGLMQQLFPKLQ